MNPTSIDLILADTDDERIRLEKILGVSPEQMTDFFYTQFSAADVISHSASRTAEQRLEAVRGHYPPAQKRIRVADMRRVVAAAVP